jgi:hypothetical protein
MEGEGEHLNACSSCHRAISDSLEAEILLSGEDHGVCKECFLKGKEEAKPQKSDSICAQRKGLPAGFSECRFHPTSATIEGFTYCLDCQEVQCSLCVLTSVHRFHEILPYSTAEEIAHTHKSRLLSRLSRQLPVYSSVNPGVDSVMERLTTHITHELDSVQTSLTEVLPKLLHQLQSWQALASATEVTNLAFLREGKRNWITLRDKLQAAEGIELLRLTVNSLGEKSRFLGQEEAKHEYIKQRPPVTTRILDIEQKHVSTLKKIKVECKKNKLLAVKLDFSKVIQAINDLKLEIVEAEDAALNEDDKENINHNKPQLQLKALDDSPLKKCTTQNKEFLPIPSKTTPRSKLTKESSVNSSRTKGGDKTKKSCFLIDVLESRFTFPVGSPKEAHPANTSNQKSSELSKTKIGALTGQPKIPKSKSPLIGRFNPSTEGTLSEQVQKQPSKMLTPIIGQRKASQPVGTILEGKGSSSSTNVNFKYGKTLTHLPM